MATPETIARTRKFGSSSGQFVQRRAINVDRLVNLLVETSQPGRHAAVRRPANELLERMSRGPWRVTASPHKGGFGADGTTHITVRVGNESACHLRLDQRGHVFQITGPGRLGQGILPWQGPGQAGGTREPR
jgi:hypothetical protein